MFILLYHANVTRCCTPSATTRPLLIREQEGEWFGVSDPLSYRVLCVNNDVLRTHLFQRMFLRQFDCDPELAISP